MKYLRGLLLLAVMSSLFDKAILANTARGDAAVPRTVSIFVYDAGETLGLLPVAPLLEARNIRAQWIPLTPWALQILEREPVSLVRPSEEFQQMPHVKDRLALSDVSYLLRLMAERKPDLAILGLVSGIQELLARELKKLGIRTVGFYDAFDTTDRDSIIWRVARQLDEVWVPTKKIKYNLDSLGLKRVKVLGQPSLETWRRLESKVSLSSLYEQLRIPPGKQILVFAGQYGDGYVEILEAFLRAAKSVLDEQEDLYIVLSPHPKTGGEAERAALLKYGHQRFIVARQGVTTAELAVASSVVITWRSTVGIQAAFLGKPVIYFNFNVRDYRNDLIEEGIAQATTPSTFSMALRTTLARQSNASNHQRKLSELGYIINSDQRIASEVIKLIAQQK
jgi:predicted glycosyltransferase